MLETREDETSEVTVCVLCGLVLDQVSSDEDEITETRCQDCADASRVTRLVPAVHEAATHDADDRLYKGYVAGVPEYGVSDSVARLRRFHARLQEEDREIKSLESRYFDGTKMRFCHLCQVALPMTGRCDDCD